MDVIDYTIACAHEAPAHFTALGSLIVQGNIDSVKLMLTHEVCDLLIKPY